MPIVPYFLGRPAHVWIAAMSRRGSAWQGTAHSETPDDQESAALVLNENTGYPERVRLTLAGVPFPG